MPNRLREKFMEVLKRRPKKSTFNFGADLIHEVEEIWLTFKLQQKEVLQTYSLLILWFTCVCGYTNEKAKNSPLPCCHVALMPGKTHSWETKVLMWKWIFLCDSSTSGLICWANDSAETFELALKNFRCMNLVSNKDFLSLMCLSLIFNEVVIQ